MSRQPGRTSLIVGKQDVEDLQVALRSRLHDAILPETRDRIENLLGRLNNAARRLERGRNGRSAAAR